MRKNPPRPTHGGCHEETRRAGNSDASCKLSFERRSGCLRRKAQGHLGELEAELGDIETAIGRLYPLATASDDPDYAAQLARILKSTSLLQVRTSDGGRASILVQEYAMSRKPSLARSRPGWSVTIVVLQENRNLMI